MARLSSEFLTTRELAELLHIKERKVYDLAASGDVPCSRVTGKLLFPRRGIEEWMAEHSSGGASSPQNRLSRVVLGSQDPLLSWALGASEAELATLFEGSLDGLERFAAGDGQATGLHIYDPRTGDWNVGTVQARFHYAPVALVEFAWRQRGFIVRPGDEGKVGKAGDLRGRRVVPRQAAAGSQVLLMHLLDQAGVDAGEMSWTEPGRTESEVAVAVLDGKADVAFGLESMAKRLRLAFVPQVRERFDLLVDRGAWFDPPLQRLWRFCGSQAFRARAEELGGYDVRGLGTVHFNGQ